MKRILDLLRLRRGVSDEFESYLEEKTADLIEQGLPPAEARLRARREFGNVALLAEQSREALGWRWLDHLIQDLRYAARTLRRSPAFTVVAVLSLALGIGANTAIFGLLDTISWKMLPVREPEKLWAVGVQSAKPGAPPSLSHSYPLYALWRDHSRSMEGLAAYSSFLWKDKSVTSNNAWHDGQFVSGNYFDVMGVPALIGRTLTAADDSVETKGGPQGAVAMLSYNYWRRAWHGDPGAIGKSINVNGAWLIVAGITPPEFFGAQVGTSPDIFVPLQLQPALFPDNLLRLNMSETTWLTVMGRLQTGILPGEAKAELSSIGDSYWLTRLSPESRTRRLTQKMPPLGQAALEPAGRGFTRLRASFSEPLEVLLVLVGIVLLIACANLAGLLLARASARRHEIAVRLAIGAGRPRLIRQLLTESLLLSITGGALGVLFALWSSRLLIRVLPQGQTPTALAVSPDHRLLGFALALSTLTALLFGLAPAIRATRLGVNAMFGRGGLATSRRSRFEWSKAVMVAEMALVVPLVVGAGLFVGTLRNLAALDTGFARENVIQARMDVDEAGIPKPQWGPVYEQLAARVAAVPGVEVASFATNGLMESGGTWSGPLLVPGYTFRPGERDQLREFSVGAGYFAASGIALKSGRVFDERDRAGAPAVAVVNEEFARHFLGGRNPIGVRYGLGKPPQFTEIVGVVGDAKYNTLREALIPMAYYHWPQQMPIRLSQIIVRTRGNSAAVSSALRKAAGEVHPDLLTQIVTLSSQIDATLYRERLLAQLSGFFGLLAMLLACIGLYGVMAYGVARRRPEIGVRMALGALPGDVFRLVLRETLLLAGAGIAIGIPVSISLTRLARGFLFGLEPNDPAVLTGAAAVLLAVCGFAGWLPARRAARVDPTVTLRYE